MSQEQALRTMKDLEETLRRRDYPQWAIQEISKWYEGERPQVLLGHVKRGRYLKTPPLKLFHWLLYLRDRSSEPFRYKVMMFYLKRFTWQQFQFVVLLFYALEKTNAEVEKLRRQLNERLRYIA